MTNTTENDTSRPTPATLLLLAGCFLFALAIFVPVMRWSVNAAHDTAGDARIWFGDEWTLADGGFEGSSLLPIASAAVVVLAIAALVGRRAWRLQVVAAATTAYVPLWTAVAFARKWEDDVDPDIGVALLVAATIAIAVGLWIGRPRSVAEIAPESRSATDVPDAPPREPTESDLS